MSTANSLLAEIQQAVGCPYLSDLHTSYQLLNEQSKARIMAIPLEQYILQEWSDAAAYITGEKCCYQTKEEARVRIAAGR